MASMLEIPMLPAAIFLIMIALCGVLAGLVLGGRIGYNDRLRKELEATIEEMQRRTDRYRAARDMPPLTPVRLWRRTRATERVETVI
jgi:uncharacterized membrane protein YdfJ with MMPL/SSD domain